VTSLQHPSLHPAPPLSQPARAVPVQLPVPGPSLGTTAVSVPGADPSTGRKVVW
jgi:hypothetical protein